MAIFFDEEFGDISVRRTRLARSIKLSVAPNGTLRVSMPAYAPLFMAKRLVASSRPSIRELKTAASPGLYRSGMQIGKSHSLEVVEGSKQSVKSHGQQIIVTLPFGTTLSDKSVDPEVRGAVSKALRKEASSYLPRRLEYLAKKYGFTYKKVRFSHASSRWGSCSSNGTISLNIALMRLPFELIDYVLLHELAHTKYMNHSTKFWDLVASHDAEYKLHRKLLKQEHPGV